MREASFDRLYVSERISVTTRSTRLILSGRDLGLIAGCILLTHLAIQGVPSELHEAARRAAAIVGRDDWVEAQLRAVVEREARPGGDELRLVDALTELADIYWRQARYADAEPLLRRAHASQQRLLGASDPATLRALARVLHGQGRYREAESLYEQTLDMWEGAADGSVDQGLAELLEWLAEMRRDQRRFAESEALYRRALAIRERAFGPRDPRIAHSLYGLGTLFRDRDMPERAELYLRRALDLLADGEPAGRFDLRSLLSRFDSDRHARRVKVLAELGAVYIGSRSFAEAEQVLLEALALPESGAYPVTRALVLRELAMLERRRGLRAEAERHLREALQAMCGRLASHPERAAILTELATLQPGRATPRGGGVPPGACRFSRG